MRARDMGVFEHSLVRRAALGLLLLVAACSAPEASPPAQAAPSGWAAPRVGDRVDLRFASSEDDHERPARASALRAFVEVVKVEPGVTWVRLGVRDEQDAPVAHPTARRDLLVPMAAARPWPPEDHGAPDGRETLETAAGRFDCERRALDLMPVDGGLTRTWLGADPALYLVSGVVRSTFRSSGMDGVVLQTTLEVAGRRTGADPAATGELPADALVLFEPGRWYATAGQGQAEDVGLHRLDAAAGRVVYAVGEPEDPAGGPTIEVGGRAYAAPARVEWDEATERRSLLDLLGHRAVAVARADEEWDPVVRWRQQPALGEGQVR